MRNIFIKKSYTKCDKEARPRPVYKKSNLGISLYQQSKILQGLISKYIKLRCWLLAFILYKSFLKM